MKRRIVLISLLSSLLFVSLFSCDDKEEYTLPTDFRMHLMLDNKAVLNGLLTIETVTINLKSIDIEGYREVGDDVFFTRDLNNGQKFVMTHASVPDNQILEFSIPQGIYDPLFISQNFLPDEEEEDIIEDIGEWLEDLESGEMSEEDLQYDLGDIIEDYLEDINPCFILKGQYERNQDTYKFVFVINDPLTFKIKAQNKNGGSEVVFKKDIINNGKMVFDPSYWFSVITPVMIDDFYVGTADEEKYIFIHKYVNSQAYAAVFNRIEESTYLVINE